MNALWRHHSVPQFLLRNFPDADGWLWHFDKRNPETGVGKEEPVDIFFQRHQYSTVDYDTDQLDPSLEHFFARKVEDPGAPIIKKVVASAHAGKSPGLSANEKSRLDRFMAVPVAARAGACWGIRC